MVHVTFYWTADPRNTINKHIEPELTTTAELYDNTDIFNPELLLAWNNNYATTYNYFYIQEFNRYYFLDDVVAEPGGAARVKGSIDVLYTYKTSIGQNRIVITRAYYSRPDDPVDPSGLFQLGGTGPTYVKDSKLPLKPNRSIHPFEFDYESLLDTDNGNYNFVLNVMGRTSSGGGD